MLSGQIPLWRPQARHSRFENFICRDESANSNLLDSLRGYVISATTTPFYLHGAPGSGKTHLLTAAINLSRDLGNKDTAYFDCANHSSPAELLMSLSESVCLCVDNIEQWAGEKNNEQALFSVVEQAKNSNQCLIISSKTSPSDSQFDLADLVSRLSSGVVFEIKSLDDQGKLQALSQFIETRNLQVEQKVLEYLITHFSRDNHSLFQVIDQLDKASMIEKRRLTIPFVQKVLSN